MYGFVGVDNLVERSRSSPGRTRPALPITTDTPAPAGCDREQRRVLAELFAAARWRAGGAWATAATTNTWRRGGAALAPVRRPRPRREAGMLLAAAMPVVLPLLSVVLLLGAFAAGGVADPARRAAVDPLPPVNAFLAAVNAGDVAAAAAQLDPDVLYQGVFVCWPEPCRGREAVALVLAREVDDRTEHVVNPQTAQTADGRVRMRGEARYASLASAERIVYELRAEVGSEGVRDLRLVPDASDGPTARVLADLAGVRGGLEAWADADAGGGAGLTPRP